MARDIYFSHDIDTCNQYLNYEKHVINIEISSQILIRLVSFSVYNY